MTILPNLNKRKSTASNSFKIFFSSPTFLWFSCKKYYENIPLVSYIIEDADIRATRTSLGIADQVSLLVRDFRCERKGIYTYHCRLTRKCLSQAKLNSKMYDKIRSASFDYTSLAFPSTMMI